ncbi:hypothetical protein ACFSW8_09180 [Rubritalea tangerina]|uniref:Verru_Chthon cassette protein A n=2 Tax=Rubritalea tangerina TaxID=430798 RepID=A0ABW4ZB13_9BACT
MRNEKFEGGRAQGFALVATISVMVLLVMIALAILSLSTVELRSSKHGWAMLEARANARMALMVALGELQESVGPDQRVTASADIHEARSADKKHITGVWTTENWEPTSPNNKEFVKWLATIPTSTTPTLEDVETPLAPFDVPGSELITIVGKGSVGEDAQAEDLVQVATVPITDNGRQTGSYAYWVADDSIKASYAISEENTPEAWEKAARTTTPYRTGMEVADSVLFENYPEVAKTNKINTPSKQTIDLNHPVDTPDDSPAKKYFHDFTSHSISLLTNTRDGGLKHDLSTAFEYDLAEFNELTEYHNSIEKNFTGNYARYGFNSTPELYPQNHSLGYLFEVPVTGTNNVLRGPTWDLLRNHYRLYKKEWDDFGWARSFNASDDDHFKARGSLPLSYAQTIGTSHDHLGREYGYRTSPGGMYVDHRSDHGFRAACAVPIRSDYDWRTALIRPTAARVAPTITRVTFVVGARKKSTGRAAPNDWKLAFSLDPYITIHNPYNRPIEFESIGMYGSKLSPFFINYEYYDTKGNLRSGDGKLTTYWNSHSALAYRLLPPSGGTFVLAPGEIKVLSPTPTGGSEQEIKYSGASHNFIEATLDYGEDSGLFSYFNANITAQNNSDIKLRLWSRARGEHDAFNFSLLSSKRPDGSAADLLTETPFPNMPSRVNVEDEDHITRVTIVSEKSSETKTFNVNSLPQLGEAGFYVGAYDLSMKGGTEDAPVFHHFSPRGQVYDYRNYDGSNEIAPSWKVEIKTVTDVSDLNLVMDPEGHGSWGGGATSKVVLYELPRAPLTALSSLSHADISLVPEDGTSQIGNSFLPAGFRESSKLFYKRPIEGEFNPSRSLMHTLTDYSWASNEMLWDQYFFSSINWGDSHLAYASGKQPFEDQDAAVESLIDSATPSPLINSRIQYVERQVDLSTLKQELKDYDKIAAHLICEGGFNVNSTSVEAWKAVLGGHNELDVQYLTKSGEIRSESNGGIPFSRFQLPAGSKSDIADKSGVDAEWSGYRTLNATEITELAESVVKQVKLRGPFMGLSDFVNRRLAPISGVSADVDKLGALQMAIEAAGINDSLRNAVSIPNIENSSINTGENIKAISTLTGAPGYLMQSDVLNSIGSILRTRSDTFTIRAYGEARGPNNEIMATAWCEATVQRTPDWLDASNEPFKQLKKDYHLDLSSSTTLDKWEANSAVSSINKKFGRKLKMTSFRWLSPQEI